MTIQIFSAVSILHHALGNKTILLQNVPMPPLEAVLIEKPPCVAFPTGDLPMPPEKTG